MLRQFLSSQNAGFRTVTTLSTITAMRGWWQQPYAFLPGWRVPLLNGLALGALLAFIIVFLEPSGTDRYQAPWRTLRLCGYGLCILLPMLLVHALNRWRARRRHGHWTMLQSLQSTLLLLLLILLSSYLYNVYAVNARQPVWDDALIWMLRIGLPYLPLLVVPGVLLQRRLRALALRQAESTGLVSVCGHNRNERLRLAVDDVLYAQAQQNYVTLCHVQGSRVKQRMLRLTLVELQQQLPQLQRVHRSYLVNPSQVQGVAGNARRRRLQLQHVQTTIPVSSRFDLRRLTPPDSSALDQKLTS